MVVKFGFKNLKTWFKTASVDATGRELAWAYLLHGPSWRPRRFHSVRLSWSHTCSTVESVSRSRHKTPSLALLCLEGTNIRVITLRPILVLVQAPLKVILTPLKFFQLHLLGVKRVQVNSECTQGEHDDGSNLKFAFALFVCADFWNNAERRSGAMQLHRSFIAASSQQ